jgi:phage-related protein
MQKQKQKVKKIGFFSSVLEVRGLVTLFFNRRKPFFVFVRKIKRKSKKFTKKYSWATIQKSGKKLYRKQVRLIFIYIMGLRFKAQPLQNHFTFPSREIPLTFARQTVWSFVRIGAAVLVIIFALSSQLGSISLLQADTIGPNNPGTNANAASGVCSDDSNWSSTAASTVNANDTSYNQITGTIFDNGDISDEMRLSNLGFAIPNGHSITGITVEVLGWAPSGASTVNYHTVQLFTAPGTNVGNNLATGSLPGADPGTTYTSFGGSSNDWGKTGGWTEAEIESANFGVALCFQASGNNRTINVDHVRITVTSTAATTTLSDGTDPSNTTIGPGAAATEIDRFGLATNIGTDTVTAVTVTLGPVGAFNNIDTVDLQTTGGVSKCSASGLTSNTVSLSSCAIAVTTTTTEYKIMVTPKSHSAMPAVPGNSYATTATVTSFTSTNTQAGTDTDSATVTIDNASPANVNTSTAAGGDQQVSLSWTNPADSDFDSVVVLRRAGSAVADVPVEGTTYTTGNTIGTATVACVTSTTSCTDTSLTNGTAYHYKIFSKDTRGNYSAGVVPSGSPATPSAITTLADGTDPSNATIGPGAGVTDIDAFTFATSSGTDTVTAVTVTLAPASSYDNIFKVEITNNSNTDVCTDIDNPTSLTLNFAGCSLSLTTSATTYKIRITPKTHTNMPPVPGASYATTATVTGWTSTNIQAGTDTDSATITVDNASPGNISSGSVSASDSQTSLTWTNPGDADFDSVVILRRAGSAVTDAPVEGSSYSAGNNVGSSTVACVSSSTSCTDSGLANGTVYHYKIFSKDSRGNYSAGVVPSGSPATPAATTTIGNGTNPANIPVAPGSGITDLNAFTLVTTSGTDSITALTVTLASGTHSGLSEVRITNDAGSTTYFTAVTNPASETINFSGGTAIPVTASSTQFKIRITPKTHANMPAPPGSSYAVTGTVTAFTSTNQQAGTDSSSATITIDNTSPANVTSASGLAGDTEVTLTWTNPADSDFDSVVVLRHTSVVSDTPVEGTTYSVGNTVGSATVACVSSSTSCTDTGLTNGTAYHYKIFSQDSRGNYATGVVPTGSPFTPVLTPKTTIGNGANPSNATIAPSSAITDLDAFTFITNTGTDSITALTVTLASGIHVGLAEVRITSNDGTTLYFTAVANPSSDVINFSGGNPIPVSTSSTQFKIRITPKTHANMPAPPGSSYVVTGTVTAFTSTNVQLGADSSSATITVDNSSPANVSSGTGVAGDAQVSLSWTNPADSDFDSVVVLRRAGSAVADVPVEGTTYTTGNTIGTATVACVTSTTSCTDTSLTNGTAYHYKIFSKDTRGNYSAGVVPSGSPATPAATLTTLGNGTNPSNTTVAPGSTITDLDSFTLVTSAGTDSITGLTVTLASGAAAALSEIRITSNDGATLYFTAVANPNSDTVNFSGGTPIPVTTSASQFKVRITPKSHANMPAVPGALYAVTGTVTAFTSSSSPTGGDASSAIITIDNESPTDITGGSVNVEDAQVSLSWTNPGDSDFDSVVVLRRSGSAVADAPAEGITYTVGNTVGSSTVACVGSSASCTDTGLTNGTAYYYKIFSKDTRGNYATGVVPAGSPATPVALSQPSQGGGLPPQSFVPPQEPAGGFKLYINNGVPTTISPEVRLSLVAGADVKRMAISNLPDLSDAGQFDFVNTKTWNLCSRNNGQTVITSCSSGTYMVYVRFYTQTGQPSKIISATITLSLEPQTAEPKLTQPQLAQPVPVTPVAQPAKPLAVRPQAPFIRQLPAPPQPVSITQPAKPNAPVLTPTVTDPLVPQVQIAQPAPISEPIPRAIISMPWNTWSSSLIANFDEFTSVTVNAVDTFVYSVSYTINSASDSFSNSIKHKGQSFVTVMSSVAVQFTNNLSSTALEAQARVDQSISKIAVVTQTYITQPTIQAIVQTRTKVTIVAQTMVQTIAQSVTQTAETMTHYSHQAATNFSSSLKQVVAVANRTIINQRQLVRSNLNNFGLPRGKTPATPQEALVLRTGELELIADQDSPIQSVVGFNFQAEIMPSKPATSIGGTYKFTDPDGDGIWNAEVQMPQIAGQYHVNTRIAYADGEAKDIKSDVLIDPEGYVYEAHPRGELRIDGAEVRLWVKEGSSWKLWPAHKYNQINPQITDRTGQYSFLAPTGTYFIEVLAKDYQSYKGQPFYLNKSNPVHQNIKLEYLGR